MHLRLNSLHSFTTHAHASCCAKFHYKSEQMSPRLLIHILSLLTMAPAFAAISPARSVGLFYPRLNRDAIASQGFAASFFDLSRYERGTGLLTKQDIRQKVTTVLCASPKISYKSFTVKADLRREFKLDNLDLTDIALELEKLFSIKVSQRDIEESFDTGLDIIDFVCHCLGVL